MGDSEREMRLNANKERFWLKQKLEKLQKAISARLKILGVDFSGVDDITAALDMAFKVIQKLAAELQKKEEGFEEMKEKMEKAVLDANVCRKNVDKLDATIEKQRGVVSDLKQQLNDKKRRLSIVGHEKDDKESIFTKQINELQNELKQIHKEKQLLFDNMVDEKAKFKGMNDDKSREIEELQNEINKLKEEITSKEEENEAIKAENDEILNINNDLNAKLNEVNKEVDELGNVFDAERNKNDQLNKKNKRLKKEMKTLRADLQKLKELISKALNIEMTLKNVLNDSFEVVVNMTSNDISDS